MNVMAHFKIILNYKYYKGLKGYKGITIMDNAEANTTQIIEKGELNLVLPSHNEKRINSLNYNYGHKNKKQKTKTDLQISSILDLQTNYKEVAEQHLALRFADNAEFKKAFVKTFSDLIFSQDEEKC